MRLAVVFSLSSLTQTFEYEKCDRFPDEKSDKSFHFYIHFDLLSSVLDLIFARNQVLCENVFLDGNQ